MSLVSIATLIALFSTLQPTFSLSSVGLGKQRTVVLVLATDCEPCTASIPFYKTLLNRPIMDGTEGRLIVLSTNGAVPVKQMLEKHNLRPHRLLSYPMTATIEIPPDAPGVYVLDAEGRRVGSWRGSLSDGQKGEVVKAIGGKS